MADADLTRARAQSREAGKRARAATDEAIRLRAEALAAVPVGASLWMDLPASLRIPPIEHVRTEGGWVVRSDDEPDAAVDVEWIEEEWARWNMRLDKEGTE